MKTCFMPIPFQLVKQLWNKYASASRTFQTLLDLKFEVLKLLIKILVSKYTYTYICGPNFTKNLLVFFTQFGKTWDF